MLKLLKDICAEALEAAGYPELAKWIRDAPRQALRKAVRIVMRALGFKGKVDKEAADELVKLQRETQASAQTPEEEVQEDDSALGQYLATLNAVLTAGSQQQYLLLDGFLHTDDCTSLWVFDKEKAASKVDLELKIDDFGGTEPYILLQNVGVRIYLLPRMSLARLLELNEQLGKGHSLPAEVSIDDKPRVQFIYETRIRTLRQTVTKKKSRSGSEREIRKTVDEDKDIAKAPDGIRALFSSLPASLQARAKYADDLRKAVGDGVKGTTPEDKQ
jgi:hypothetical protein